MTPQPDLRWQNIVGGVDRYGRPEPMSAEVLEDLVASWSDIVAGVEDCGSLELLDASRALFVQSWFRLDLLVQASLVALQAVEAGFRQVMYPNASSKIGFKKLVDRAQAEGVFSHDQAELIRAGVDLRNILSHPGGQPSWSLGMAGEVVQAAHLVVRDLCRWRGMVV